LIGGADEEWEGKSDEAKEVEQNTKTEGRRRRTRVSFRFLPSFLSSVWLWAHGFERHGEKLSVGEKVEGRRKRRRKGGGSCEG